MSRKHKRKNHSASRTRSKVTSTEYSQLETRKLLAATVTLEGGVLTIGGDNFDNSILIISNPVDDTYDVTTDYGVDRSNIDAGSFNQADVASISFRGRHGNDFINNSTDLPMTAYGHSGDDTFFGGGGIDIIYGGNGDDAIHGSAGEDILRGNDGLDAIFGGAGNDYINGGPIGDSIFGGEGDDTIYGERGDDVIFAGSGDDVVYAFSGEDSIYGEDGNDFLYGQSDDDRIRGGEGDDRLRGNPGADDLDGEEGNDFVKGDQGDDLMEGGDGNDQMHGFDGNDRMMGGAGNDLMYGQNGNDYMNGGDGNDVVRGGNDDDRLYGEAGADIVRGDAGMDGISGGIGTEFDRLFGNAGPDRFITEATDQVMDRATEDAVLRYEGDSAQWNDAEMELMDTALEVMHHRTESTILLTDLHTGTDLTFTKVATLPGTAFGSNVVNNDNGQFTRTIQFKEFDEEGLFDKSDFLTSVYVQIGRNFDNIAEFSVLESSTTFEDFMLLSEWTEASAGDPGFGFQLSNDEQWYFSSFARFTFANDDSDPEDNPFEDFATTWEYYFDRYSSGSDPIGMTDKYGFFDDLFNSFILP